MFLDYFYNDLVAVPRYTSDSTGLNLSSEGRKGSIRAPPGAIGAVQVSHPVTAGQVRDDKVGIVLMLGSECTNSVTRDPVTSRTAKPIRERAVLYGNPQIGWPVRESAAPLENGV